MDRTSQVLGLVRQATSPLDDDEVAGRLGMNRHYVNRICRHLAAEGLISRRPGPSGKVVNSGPGEASQPLEPTRQPRATTPRVRRRRVERARANVEALVGDFAAHVERFEASNAFPGPSLYFHERAIALRRRHRSAEELLADDRFLEYVYAVLPAWGMHRMGKQAAKVGDFGDMVESFRSASAAIGALWPLRITDLGDAEGEAEQIWDVIASLRVSTSGTKIVAGSKALHHVLPDLVPPIDRQYTFRFFTGQKMVTAGDRRAFLEWFPYLAEIGTRCRPEIEVVIERGGFMATGEAKVIDNAIIGFMQALGVEPDPEGE